MNNQSFRHLSLLAACLLALAGSAYSQPDFARGGGPGGPGPGRGQGMGRGPGRMGEFQTSPVLQMLTKKLSLTSDQQAKVKDILDQTRNDVKESGEKIKAAIEKTRTDVAGVLTDEQKKKFEDARNAMFQGVGGFVADHASEIRQRAEQVGDEIRIRIAMSRLDLSDDQREKVRDLGEKMRDKTREIREEIRPKMEQVRKDTMDKLKSILTAEQQTQLDKYVEEQPMGGPDGGDGGPGAGGRFGGRMGRAFRGATGDGNGPQPPDGPPGPPDMNGPRGPRGQSDAGDDDGNMDQRPARRAQKNKAAKNDEGPDTFRQ